MFDRIPPSSGRVASIVFLPPTFGRNLPDVAYVSGEMALTRHDAKLLIEMPMMRSMQLAVVFG
jgi:hypothetical protein